MKEKNEYIKPKMLRLKIKDGKVKINGKTLDLSDFLIGTNKNRSNVRKNYLNPRENYL